VREQAADCGYAGRPARRILLTGASSGIGLAACRALLARGWTVFGGVRREQDARRLGSELGPGFTALRLELTDPRSVASACEAVREAVGAEGLDALVNNAGAARLGPLAGLSTAELREQFEVNLFGLHEVTLRFLPLLRAASRRPPGGEGPRLPARIVNMGSSSGRLAMPFFGAYAASKHALEALSDSLRRELRLHGIRVVLLEPSIVRTPLVEKALAQAEAYRGGEWWPAIQAAVRHAGLERPGGTLSVERVVRVLLKALDSPRPRARYADPRHRQLGWWLPRALPDRVRDRLLGRLLGLDPREAAPDA